MTMFAKTLHSIARWLVSVSQWFNGWDITLLVPALIILGVIAGVTGRAVMGGRLWQQILWGSVTVLLSLMEIAIMWIIVARYMPIQDFGTLIERMLLKQPLLPLA